MSNIISFSTLFRLTLTLQRFSLMYFYAHLYLNRHKSKQVRTAKVFTNDILMSVGVCIDPRQVCTIININVHKCQSALLLGSLTPVALSLCRQNGQIGPNYIDRNIDLQTNLQNINLGDLVEISQYLKMQEYLLYSISTKLRRRTYWK